MAQKGDLLQPILSFLITQVMLLIFYVNYFSFCHNNLSWWVHAKSQSPPQKIAAQELNFYFDQTQVIKYGLSIQC